MHKILWDSEIQILAKIQDLVLINKKRTCHFEDFFRRDEKLWNTKVTVIPIVVGALWNGPQEPGKR